MSVRVSDISWWRVILGGVSVVAATWISVFVVVTGYAARLGFKMRGAPPQDMISAFADRVAPMVGPIAGVVLAFAVAYWVARRVAVGPIANALGVGIVATGLLMALMRSFSLRSAGFWVLTLAASGAAGWLASRRAPDGQDD